MPRNYDNGKKLKKEKKRRRKMILQLKLGLNGKKKQCYFTKEGMTQVDYKDAELLKRFITDRGSIVCGRTTGTIGRMQKRLAIAIKRARYMALLPYCPEKYL